MDRSCKDGKGGLREGRAGCALGHIRASVWRRWRDISVVERPQVAGGNRYGLCGGKAVRERHGRRWDEETERTVRVLRGVYATAIVSVQSAHELRERRMDQGRS